MDTIINNDNKRMYELDITRAISILLLPMIHVFEDFRDAGLLSKSAEILGDKTIMLANKYAPSVFLFLFGMNLVFAKPVNSKEYFKRGVHFLIIFLVINLLRSCLFSFVFGVVNGDIRQINNGINYLFYGDVYAFVGLFLITYALFVRLNIKVFYMLCISIITIMISNAITMFYPISTEESIFKALLGNITYIDYTSPFPLLLWMIHPISGIAFANLYKKISENEDNKLTICIETFVILNLIYIATFFFRGKHGMMSTNLYDVVLNDYDFDIVSAILLVTTALSFISFIYILYRYVRIDFIHNFLLNISKNIMPFYAIQWIIIANLGCFLHLILKAKDLSFSFVVIIFIVVTIITSILAIVFGEKINNIMKYKGMPEKAN